MQTIKFTLSGNFAHYKRLDGASVKQTHTIPTRTSIFGLIGAILGRPRDSYYDEFGDNLQMSIVPQNIRRYTIPQLELSTSSTPFLGSTGIRVPKHRENRQRTSIEYLVNPKFDVYLRSEEFPEDLIERLEKRKYEFSPFLGTTECLASITYHGFVETTQVTEKEVDSVVPESDIKSVSASNEDSITFERMAKNFSKTEAGRNANGYLNVIVNLTNNNPLQISPNENTEIYEAEGKKLMFV